MSTNTTCTTCGKSLTTSEREFAENQEEHPGILGVICQSCYQKACETCPELPWTDPISGAVDWDAMKGDLGISDGTEEWKEEEF